MGTCFAPLRGLCCCSCVPGDKDASYWLLLPQNSSRLLFIYHFHCTLYRISCSFGVNRGSVTKSTVMRSVLLETVIKQILCLKQKVSLMAESSFKSHHDFKVCPKHFPVQKWDQEDGSHFGQVEGVQFFSTGQFPLTTPFYQLLKASIHHPPTLLLVPFCDIKKGLESRKAAGRRKLQVREGLSASSSPLPNFSVENHAPPPSLHLNKQLHEIQAEPVALIISDATQCVVAMERKPCCSGQPWGGEMGLSHEIQGNFLE